ncbi:MAG: hypothetical protein IPO41_00605 [Acidobacteria bacterium]|nr:hypothetical protein [Acidobacteriota bacterium]MBK9526847.1 hypothetical protein [Acidobacteriota bacterium]MBP7476505.1 hypothetical protein [Pyrinomonadaceae bacterium]MBP9109409.1 hypothetical protein [Pyrinomonadaceae bacterium]
MIKFNKFFALIVVLAIAQSAFAVGATDIIPEAPAFSDWQVVGPSGGDVRVVAIDPKDKNRLYMSTLDGQIHTSADAGSSWRLLVNFNKPELILDQLMVDARDSKIIYTSGHRHKAPGGFFRSTDGGATWKEAKELKDESIHSMTQSSLDPRVIIVGTIHGVWQSKNSGEDWERLASTTSPVNVDALAMDPRNTSTMYAGTWWRAYKTTDAGKSWRLIKNGMIDDSDVFAITVDPRNPDYIIASACSGIYDSQNGGEKWSKIQGIPSQSRRTRDILMHPTIAGTIYAGTTEGFWMSSNGGKSWALTTQRNLEINSIAVHPEEPNRVYIGTNNFGLMVSNDGGKNFTPNNGNFTSRFTYLVTSDVQQPNRLYAATHNTATGGGFFFISSDGGRTWQQARNLDVNRVRVLTLKQDPLNPNSMFLGTNLGIYRSIDRGNSWAPLPAGKVAAAASAKKPVAKAPAKGKPAPKTVAPKPVAGPRMLASITEKVKAIEFLPANGGMLVGTDTGVYRSRDLAKGWEKLPIQSTVNSNIFALHVAPSRPNTYWAGTATSGVLVSGDAGLTWVKSNGAADNIPVSSITSDPKRPDYIYVGSTQTFYTSKDNGATWSRRGGGLPLGNFTSILINPGNTEEIVVSSSLDTGGGMYISSDSGNRWKRIDNNDMKLASRRIWSISFDPQDANRIFAATHSSGVYKIERSGAVSGN